MFNRKKKINKKKVHAQSPPFQQEKECASPPFQQENVYASLPSQQEKECASPPSQQVQNVCERASVCLLLFFPSQRTCA